MNMHTLLCRNDTAACAAALMASVDIALIAALTGEPGEIGLGRGWLHLALLGDDVGEAAIDIARHPLLIAADIDVRTLLEPRPQLGGMLQEPVLDVDLLVLVARKRGVEPGQQPAAVPGQEFVLEQEIGHSVRVAEKQP